MDTLLLSRIQFGANISFHILFPTITIALCWYLFYFKFRFHQTHDPVWMRAYRFWVKIFALSFALGVVSGITMSFQFGTNWPGFMEKVGNIAGPLLGYEVLTAFFLEATFLGIMLFGREKVSETLHTISTLIVAIGTTLSAFWILSLNSWMHTPTGFSIVDGQVMPQSWFEIIFNPSFPYRFVHTLLASGITASFLILGLSAYRILKGDSKKAPRTTFKTAIFAVSIMLPIQVFVGDLHGLNTLEHQPQKVAAMEGLWHDETGAPLLLFAIPDTEKQENTWEVKIPYLASLILTHSFDGHLQGLSSFPEESPPMAPVFFSFRIMVGMGLTMIALAWLSLYLYYRQDKTLFSKSTNVPIPKYLLRIFVLMTFSGWIATLAGWYVTEVGRQPYIVSGLLTTSDAVTQIPSSHVGFSLLLYLIVYTTLLFIYIRTLFHLANNAINTEEHPSITQKENLNYERA